MALGESVAEQVERERERLKKIEFPKWLPSVIERALRENLEPLHLLDDDGAVALRLAQNEKMKSVWDVLKTHAPKARVPWIKNRRLARYRLRWGPLPDDDVDLVLFSYFETAHWLASSKVSIFSQAHIQDLRDDWRRKAKALNDLSKWLKGQASKNVPITVMGLAEHYARGVDSAAAFCAHVGEELSSQIPAGFDRVQLDAKTRSFVYTLAKVVNVMLGEVLYGTLATTANVALAPKVPVTKKNVIYWCADIGGRPPTNKGAKQVLASRGTNKAR